MIYVASLASPFIVWLALYVAARWGSIGLRPTLSWFRILRWVSFAAGIAFFLTYLFHGHFLGHFLDYGLAMVTLSAGLSFPERWVKRRFVSDLSV